MKTKDAFALRDFDETHILQKKFFQQYSPPQDLNLSDTRCIAAYRRLSREAAPQLDFDLLNFDIQRLTGMLKRVEQYQMRLVRHNDKLLRYATHLIEKYDVDETIQNKVRRAKNLSTCYANIAKAVISLQKLIHETIAAFEGDSETFLRRRFGARLKKARIEAGLTQQQLANKIQMSQGGYTQYELARRDPSIPTLIKLSRILNYPTDWLLGLTP